MSLLAGQALLTADFEISHHPYENGMYPLRLAVFSVPGSTTMKRLSNLYALVELGKRLGDLRAKIKSTSSYTPIMTGNVGEACIRAIQGLEEIIKTDDIVPIPSSREAAQRLQMSINDLVSGQNNIAGMPFKQAYDERINAYFTGPILENLDTFLIALSEEIKSLRAYYVDPGGNLSADKLLDGAHMGYPPDAIAALDQQCKDEIDEAGRCIVFERATAAGFHILRSVELTIKKYLSLIPGFVMPPLNRQNWGEYIKLLKDNGATKQVTDHLQNIKDNYRNPLMHPEDTLEIWSAISLFNLCQSMTESLVKDMRTRGFIK